MNYNGQNVAILGCGRSGSAAARLARREGASVTLLDSGDAVKLSAVGAELEAEGFRVLLGDEALSADAAAFDLAVISPGIALEWPLAAGFARSAVRIIGEMEFAFSFCSSDIIGVTGTNGKTTTVELIERLLTGCGERAVVAGNYGRPLSDVVCAEQEFSAVALEISSFQLESIENFRPGVAVWTNFAPDHLDRYPDVDAYRVAKLRLFENQRTEDWAVVNSRESFDSLAAQTVTFSAFDPQADYSFEDGRIMAGSETLLEMSQTMLRGTHNAENLMAALAVGTIRGHAAGDMAASLADYTAPPHRCELIATVGGVDYINDSKATNLHALESALIALGGEDQPLVLIAGGKDKGLPFGDLTDTVARYASEAVLIGEIRHALCAAWGAALPCHESADLNEAVLRATELAPKGGLVLFAPGTSSFDMFTGYEQRGDAFREAVFKLNQQPTQR